MIWLKLSISYHLQLLMARGLRQVEDGRRSQAFGRRASPNLSGGRRRNFLEERPRTPLMRKQPALAMEPAAIACQRCVCADHPMARHNDGDGIGAIRRSDRAYRLRLSDRGSKRAVAYRAAGRDAAERGLDSVLEGRAVCFGHEIGNGIEIAVKVSGERMRCMRRPQGLV